MLYRWACTSAKKPLTRLSSRRGVDTPQYMKGLGNMVHYTWPRPSTKTNIFSVHHKKVLPYTTLWLVCIMLRPNMLSCFQNSVWSPWKQTAIYLTSASKHMIYWFSSKFVTSTIHCILALENWQNSTFRFRHEWRRKYHVIQNCIKIGKAKY